MSEPRNLREEQDPDAGLEGLGHVSAAFRRASSEVPPAYVDDAILAASRRAVQTAPRPAGRRFPARRLRLVSIAAVLVLGVAVTLNIYRGTEGPGAGVRSQMGKAVELDEYELPAEGMADDSAAKTTGSGETAPEERKELQSRPTPRDVDAAGRLDTAGPTPAAPVSIAEEQLRTTEPQPRAEPATAPAMRRMLRREVVETRAPMPDDSAKAAGAAPEAIRLSGTAKKAAASGSAATGQSGELAEIARLWEAHREAEAVAALRAFVNAHPGIPVAELEAVLPQELVARALTETTP